MNYVCSYSDILFFYVSVAAELDNRPEMMEITTGRMVKQAEKAKKPNAPKMPIFLERCSQGKRSRAADGGIRSPFVPSWGICEQDSALGSPHLALDWAKWPITPADRLTVSVGEKSEESELLGAQALYQVCHPFSVFGTYY